MSPLPVSNDGDQHLLVAYSISREEEMTEAVVNAFLAVDIDVYENPTRLVDWIDPDVFDVLDWSGDRPHYLSTRIWDHRVVITADEIRIYTQPPYT